MDRRHQNKTGCKGYKIETKDIIDLYLSGKTLVEVANRFGISHWTVLDRLKKVGIKKNHLRLVKSNNAFEIFNEANCYWAGFIAADGFVSRCNIGMELSSIDDAQLMKLCRFVERDEFLWKRTRIIGNKTFEYSAISINSQKITDDLRNNFNIVPAKSKILKPPAMIPQELIRHYIRGYIDGDGCIGWHKYNNNVRLSLCSGSKELIEWADSNIIVLSGVKARPSIAKRKEASLYSVGYHGRYVMNILDWLYEGSTPEIRLDRKYDRYTRYKKHLEEYKASKLIS